MSENEKNFVIVIREIILKCTLFSTLIIALVIVLVSIILNINIKNQFNLISNADLVNNENEIVTKITEIINENATSDKRMVVYTESIYDITSFENSNMQKYDALSSIQYFTYYGTVDYYIDLSDNNMDIIFDNENKIITLQIYHANRDYISISTDMMEFFDFEKGQLNYDALQLTSEQSDELQSFAELKFREKLSEKKSYETADQMAALIVLEKYSRLVKEIDSSYSMEIEFK